MGATNAELGRNAVLVDQAAEPVSSLDAVNASELPKHRIGDWDLEIDPAVRTIHCCNARRTPSTPS